MFMYKFGDIVSYVSYKNNKKPIVIVSDVKGYSFGYALSNKKTGSNPDRYIEIPEITLNDVKYSYIDIKNNLGIESLYLIDENKNLNSSSMKKLRSKLEILSNNNELREGIIENLELTDRLAYSRSRLEPLSTEYHMPTMDDLYPNGTGRTKEEFEEDTKHIPKKYLLKYYELKDKQQ